MPQHPMYRFLRFTSTYVAGFVSAILLIAIGDHAAAADKAKIRDAIAKGQQYLLTHPLVGPHATLAGFALIKSGLDKHNPVAQQAVQEIGAKIQDGTYRPGPHHVYEAGIDLMLLEAIDPEGFRPQMEAITAFLISTQFANGSWFYPVHPEPDAGDTSISQYAILGLWASSRAGIEVPIEVLERTARWHMTKQLEDGGFSYHPYENNGGPPSHRRSSDTMTAAGTSTMLIIRRMLFGEVNQDVEVRTPESKRRFGVLERFVDEKIVKKKDVAGPTPTIRITELDKSIKESNRWTISHFGGKNPGIEQFYTYYFYSIERVAALADIEKIGSLDWYDVGSDELVRRQFPDGSWTDDCTPPGSTALSLLFLSKATTSIVAPKRKVNLLGGGLQIGGRGLPTDLDAVQMKDGAVSARKIIGPVDNLLIELERSADAKVEGVQAAVVEAVQLDRPEDLIGQVDRLRKLAVDSRVEVRRIAMWALGRTGDISTAPLLIFGLADPDQTVMREASLGLCFLSRRPEGCGKAIDPLDDTQMGLSEESTDQERKLRIEEWSAESTKRWKEWYSKIRPYDERDDRATLKRTNK